MSDEDYGIMNPAGLAGLVGPNAGEINAAKMDRPMLLAAYGLQRQQGYDDLSQASGAANRIKAILAMRKMQQERIKNNLQYGTQAHVTNRIDQPSKYITSLMRGEDAEVPDMVAGYPQSVIAKNQKGDAGGPKITITRESIDNSDPNKPVKESVRTQGRGTVPTPPAKAGTAPAASVEQRAAANGLKVLGKNADGSLKVQAQDGRTGTYR